MKLKRMWLIVWLIAALVKYVGYEIWVYPETFREKIEIVDNNNKSSPQQFTQFQKIKFHALHSSSNISRVCKFT